MPVTRNTHDSGAYPRSDLIGEDGPALRTLNAEAPEPSLTAAA
jgi:hypothetical protein